MVLALAASQYRVCISLLGVVDSCHEDGDTAQGRGREGQRKMDEGSCCEVQGCTLEGVGTKTTKTQCRMC